MISEEKVILTIIPFLHFYFLIWLILTLHLFYLFFLVLAFFLIAFLLILFILEVRVIFTHILFSFTSHIHYHQLLYHLRLFKSWEILQGDSFSLSLLQYAFISWTTSLLLFILILQFPQSASSLLLKYFIYLLETSQ